MYGVVVLSESVVAGAVVLIIVLAIIAAFAIGRVIFRVDSKIEELKYMALEIANTLTKQGFERIPKVLTAIVIRDRSGVLDEVKEAYAIYKDPKLAAIELYAFLMRQLKAELDDTTSSNKPIYDLVADKQMSEDRQEQLVVDRVAAKTIVGDVSTLNKKT